MRSLFFHSVIESNVEGQKSRVSQEGEVGERFEAGLVERASIDAVVELYETRIGPRNGAKVVARAWVDPALLEAAVERFQRLLVVAPRAWENRYNLACAYSKLGRLEEALAQLRIALDNDAQGLFLQSAATDPDLVALRATPGYQELVAGRLLDPRLGVKQIVALRFAPDEEFVDLARRAAEESMEPDTIKQAIRNWRADHYRV